MVKYQVCGCYQVYAGRAKSNRKLIRQTQPTTDGGLHGKHVHKQEANVNVVFHKTKDVKAAPDYVVHHGDWNSQLQQQLTHTIGHHFNLDERQAQKISVWIGKNFSTSSLLYQSPFEFYEKLLEFRKLQAKYPQIGVGMAIFRWPKLLHYRVEYLEETIQNFTYRLPEFPWFQMINRYPSLFARESSSLISTLELLNNLLGEENTIKAVIMTPNILNYSQENLFQSIDKIEIIFGGRDVKNFIASKPQIVGYSDIEGRLKKLTEIFEFSFDKTLDLVLKQPGIVSMGLEHVELKFVKVKTMCSLEVEWNEQFKKWTLAELGRVLTCSMQRIDRLRFIHYNFSEGVKKERSAVSWLIIPDIEFYRYEK